MKHFSDVHTSWMGNIDTIPPVPLSFSSSECFKYWSWNISTSYWTDITPVYLSIMNVMQRTFGYVCEVRNIVTDDMETISTFDISSILALGNGWSYARLASNLRRYDAHVASHLCVETNEWSFRNHHPWIRHFIAKWIYDSDYIAKRVCLSMENSR